MRISSSAASSAGRTDEIDRARSSLSTKVIGVLLLASLVVFVPLAYVNIDRTRHNLETAYVDRALTVARALDAGIRSQAELRSSTAKLADLQKMIWLDPEILGVDINLPSGEGLVTTISDEATHVGQSADELSLEVFREDEVRYRIEGLPGARVMTVATPVHVARRVVGTYEISMTLEAMDRRILEAIRQSIVSYGIALLLFSALVQGILSRFVFRPVAAIDRGVAAVAEGRLDHVVPVSSQDELGQLASSLNRMVVELANARRALSDSNAELSRIASELEVERTSLSMRVDQRTSELSAANAELGHALRAKDEFVATMSHELRTPLTAILGTSEALLEGIYGDVTDNQEQALQRAYESGQQLLILINDVLDLARIESGRLELERDVVFVSALCEDSLSLIAPLARQKGHTVELRLDPEVESLLGDRLRLKQTLVNLLDNAVKFAPDGGHIELEVRGDRARAEAKFIVRDSGVGIDQADFERLFEPFAQLDHRLSRSFAGSGLGLSLVHRFAELHGGRVSVASALGEGSTFTVVLPWRPEPSA